MPTRPQQSPAAWHLPTRAGAAWRAVKVGLHIVRRAVLNACNGPRRWPPGASALAGAPVLVERRSSLWDDGRDDEFLLRAGKVQNLRLAVRAFDGIVLPAGQTLSFWAQLGRMSRRRGFAVGREIIAGCVVPTIGGGICQLSNALAQAAVAAGIELTEWHRHSARIEAGAVDTSAAGIDATVAWNYIDLRLKSPYTVRIEAALSANELIVRLRALDVPAPPPSPSARTIPLRVQATLQPSAPGKLPPVARGCLTCGETRCFRHQPAERHAQARRAVAVGAYVPELADWLAESADDTPSDWLLGWERPTRRRWTPPAEASVQWLRMPTLKRMARSLWQRRGTGEGGARQRNLHRHAANLAAVIARRLRPEHLSLVLTQDLLVPLWRSGALAGRRFEVWVDALPAEDIQRRLDAASQRNADAASLRDFRVDAAWLRDEHAALAAAQRLLTAHAEVARVLRTRGLAVEQRPWRTPSALMLPRTARTVTHPPTLAFPASALPRKGAALVAEAARQLDARVLIFGTPPGAADAEVWRDVNWRAVRCVDQAVWQQIDAVLLPALIEHQPRALLQALAAGIPVIATPACGLPEQPGLTLVEPDNPQALLVATRRALDSQMRV